MSVESGATRPIATVSGRLAALQGTFGPGLSLAAVIAMAAHFVSAQYGGPLMLYALLFGAAFNFLADHDRIGPGVQFTTRTILRVGVALLGVRITLAEVGALGAETVLLVIAGVALTILAGWRIGRRFGLSDDHAVLSASAVAICGASAALAMASVLPAREEQRTNTLLTIVGVTTLSTLAMILYPLLAGALALDGRQAGVFLGATIHDVAQVVGAGYMISDEAGKTATVVKLMRVATLVPAMLIIGWVFRSARGGEQGRRVPLLPGFLLAYIALLTINSAGVLPTTVTALLADLSSWCIAMAVAALGVTTPLQRMVAVGPRPLGAMAAQSAFLVAFVLAWDILPLDH